VDDTISGQPPVLLRPLGISDEKQARQAHWELAQDAFDFLLDLERGEPWRAYLARLERLRLGVEVPKGWVPATFLVAEVEGEVVGRVSIRHQLNPYLAEVAGHIGIGVRPGLRRRGYATAILRESLSVAAATGLARVLVTCDAYNAGSIKVIENCGGVLEDLAAARRSVRKCRFWVEAPLRAVQPRPSTSRTKLAHRLASGRSEATSQITVTAEADQPESAPTTPPSPQLHRWPKHGSESAMGQRVSVITLGVADVKRSAAFYERLGWQGQVDEETVFFRVGGIALVLSGRDKLARGCGLHDEQAGGFGGVVLAHDVGSDAEVDSVITLAEQAGATVTRHPARTLHGGYAAFFADPDGHSWEVAHNPGLPLAEGGSITVPDFSSP
jgi:predicted acetyltransferase/catechol 2,3-dioxygenase-like lactoylglutathione lyase family enzyme